MRRDPFLARKGIKCTRSNGVFVNIVLLGVVIINPCELGGNLDKSSSAKSMNKQWEA